MDNNRNYQLVKAIWMLRIFTSESLLVLAQKWVDWLYPVRPSSLHNDLHFPVERISQRGGFESYRKMLLVNLYFKNYWRNSEIVAFVSDG